MMTQSWLFTLGIFHFLMFRNLLKKYAFSNWIIRTEPELSTSELLDLKGHIGQRIAAVLPSPETVGKMLQGDFTKGDA